MRYFTISNTRRRGRALLAVAMATVALVALLGVLGSLPTAEARGPATANTGNSGFSLSSSDAITIFLPIIFKSDLVYFDDFSNPKASGWQLLGDFGDCDWRAQDGHLRVTVSAKDEVCMNYNPKIKQLNGTFKIRMRRKSAADKLFYGFVFDAGSNAMQYDGTGWYLQVYPKRDPDCNDKPFFWLTALKEGVRKFWNIDKPPEDHHCTDKIDRDKDDWNELAVVRDGRRIKVYIKEGSTYKLLGDYPNVPLLDDNEEKNLGYFDLQVVSFTSDDIVVEFDDLEIRSGTALP